MRPQLSLIIPFYGTADKKMLERCLASIYCQDLKTEDYEIILADDQGKGLGGARNNGIRKAQGEYILFIDADDYLFPNALSRCISLLTHRPDMLSFGYQKVSHSNESPRKNKYEQYKMYPSGAAFMNEHNFMGTAWRHLFLREWLLKYQLTFSENTFHEDEAFMAKAYFHAQTTIITDWLVYAYYQCPQSILHRQDNICRIKRIQDFRLILTSLQTYLKEHAEASQLQKQALQRRIHFLTIDYIIQLKRNHCSLSTYYQVINELKKNGLLPLPLKKYSWKYSIARVIINLFASL